MHCPRLLPALLITAACAVPRAAAAQQVRHCETMEGVSVYTDKRCEDIGAMDALPRPAQPAAGNVGNYARPSSSLRSTCSRTLSDLVYQVSAAVDAGDVNRLAGVYHWMGVSDRAANRVLDQLQAIVERPLLDIVPVRPAAPADEAAEGLPAAADADADADGGYPMPGHRSRPVGLKLMQTTRNGKSTVTTTFGLRRNFNCFWISL